MTKRIYHATVVLHSALVANAPKDTWNLALNSIRIVQDNYLWYIVIGGETAPYAEYTNEPWQNGVNPNEGWIENTIEKTIPMIEKIMSGALSESEIKDFLQRDSYQKIADEYRRNVEEKLKERSQI